MPETAETEEVSEDVALQAAEALREAAEADLAGIGSLSPAQEQETEEEPEAQSAEGPAEPGYDASLEAEEQEEPVETLRVDEAGAVYYGDVEITPDFVRAALDEADKLRAAVEDAEAEKERLGDWARIIPVLEQRISSDPEAARLLSALLQPESNLAEYGRSEKREEEEEEEYDELSQIRQVIRKEIEAVLSSELPAIRQGLVQAQLPAFRQAVDGWISSLESEFGVKLDDEEKERVVRTAAERGHLEGWQSRTDNPLEESFLSVKARDIMRRYKTLEMQRKANSAPPAAGRATGNEAAREQLGQEDPSIELARMLRQLAS